MNYNCERAVNTHIEMASPFIVNIDFGAGNITALEVDSQMTVKEVKEQLPLDTLGDRHLALIFQGKELSDETILQQYDLGANSNLHAIKSANRKHRHPQNASSYRPSNGINPISLEGSFMNQGTSHGLNDIREIVDGASQDLVAAAIKQRPHFYVYCKSVCDKVQIGKVRVCCSVCKQGAFTLSREPSSWSDVLTVGVIPGHCHTESCIGETAEFYFKCAVHEGSVGNEHTCIPLPQIRSNVFHIPCAACLDIRDPVFVFECDDGHSLCLECFEQYCLVKLTERSFTLSEEHGYTLPCPVMCDDSLVTNVHHFYILGQTKYERYKRFGAEEHVIQHGGVICPTVGCEAALLIEGHSRLVICQYGCKRAFCRDCKEDYHDDDCSCEASNVSVTTRLCDWDPANVNQSRWNRMSRQTIVETTKPCPKCRVATEKADGCMHMTCTCCSFDWCWTCHAPWTNDCIADHWFG